MKMPAGFELRVMCWMEEEGDPRLAGHQRRRALLGLLKWKVFPAPSAPFSQEERAPFLSPTLLFESQSPSGMAFFSKLLLGEHRSPYHPLTHSSTTFPSKTSQFGTRQLPGCPRAQEKQGGVPSAQAPRTLQHLSQEQGLSLGVCSHRLSCLRAWPHPAGLPAS